MGVIKEIVHTLFYATLILLALWLSFFVEPIQSKYGNLIVFSLFFLLVVSLLADRKKIRLIFFDKQDVFLWVYLLILTIGLFFCENIQIAIKQYVKYAFPIPIIYFLFKSKFYLVKDKKKIAQGICILASIVSIIGILEFAFKRNIIYELFVYNCYHDLYIGNQRVMSTLHAPQPLGTYLIACMPMALFLIYNQKGDTLRILAIVTIILCGITLILTFSRGPLLGLIVAAIVYFYKKNKKVLVSLLIFIIIAVALFTIYGTGSPTERLGIVGWTAYSDYQHRATRVITIFKILKDHPFIGLGLEHYRFLFDRYFFIKNIRHDWRVTDNMFLLILGESGILGFLSFSLFIFALLKKTYRKHSEFAFAVFIALIGILTNMLTYDLLYWTVPFYIFWIYCGMLASDRLEEKIR